MRRYVKAHQVQQHDASAGSRTFLISTSACALPRQVEPKAGEPPRNDLSSSGSASQTSSYLGDSDDEDSLSPTATRTPKSSKTASWRGDPDLVTFSDEMPPGPDWLRWVDGTVFTGIAAIIIIINIVVMASEALHPDRVEDFEVLDQLFMFFYVTELVLKACLWQSRWLSGPCTRVAWNWLDFVIVCTCCLDMYVMPLLAEIGAVNANEGFKFAPWMRALRLLRLARMLRVLRVFWMSDMAWTEGERFQLFMMCVIGASCLTMGFEADYPNFFMWFYLEQMVLGIFAFELTVRLKNWGWEFFTKEDELVWNWLDFVIVVGGVVDQWMMPIWQIALALAGKREEMTGTEIGKVMMMLRMARLLRILRLVRLIKNIPPLFNLLKGIAQAMAGMMWVLLLTTVLLYACTLLCVKLVRDGIVYGGEAPIEVVEVFPNVPDTFFALFSIMNGNTSLLEPLFSTLPMSKLVYTAFTIISSWAILSILTAVVSENMINSTNQLLADEKEQETKAQCEERKKSMSEIFDKIDTNHDDRISQAEFLMLLNHPEWKDQICEAADMNERELVQIFADTQRGKFVSREKYLSILHTKNEAVTVRTILRLEKHLEALQDEIVQLKSMVQHLQI